MRQQFGNAIPSPSFNRAGFIADQEILSSTNAGSYNQRGVTLKSGQGVLQRGTLLKRNATSKQYEKATTAATAEGILRATVDTGTDPAGPTYQANILFSGIVQLNKIKDANSGVAIDNTVLGGRANVARNFFKF